jgi:hypothetical protein
VSLLCIFNFLLVWERPRPLSWVEVSALNVFHLGSDYRSLYVLVLFDAFACSVGRGLRSEVSFLGQGFGLNV